MKRFFSASLLLMTLSAACTLCAADFGTINVRKVVEDSKIGKSEQTEFDQIRKQLEQSLEAKEKELNELAPKLKEEYLDTLTPEAENELKNKFNQLTQEMSYQQNEYYKTLNEANYDLMKKIYGLIQEASSKISQQKQLKGIMNDETFFYRDDTLDVTADVVVELDKMYDSVQKK